MTDFLSEFEKRIDDYSLHIDDKIVSLSLEDKEILLKVFNNYHLPKENTFSVFNKSNVLKMTENEDFKKAVTYGYLLAKIEYDS